MPPITLYFLQASRCIRTAWLLEELGLDYEIRAADRENQRAPQWLKDEAGGLGKFPTLRDGEVVVYESGNITEYLCDKYDKAHRLLPPPGDPKRYAVLQWVHAAEGTFALHALPVLYGRWFSGGNEISKMEEGMSANVQKDFDYLESALAKNEGKFLFGDVVTAADTMMEFTVDFVFRRELGTKGKRWEGVERYLKACQETETWKRAQRKTGHKL